MSRWKLVENRDRDLASLSVDQLSERLTLARDRERSSSARGMGKNPKAAREWRARAKSVEAELERRSAQGNSA